MNVQRWSPGLTHRLVLSAAALMLLNDLVLRGVAPGWLTGKLSDVGWLIVVPVVATVGLRALGFGPRPARGIALAGAAAFYTLLQLWPPLGAWLQPGHVADVGDLLVLPAILGAVVVWRAPTVSPRWRALVAGPFLVGALLADKWWHPPETTVPCGEGMIWDPTEPLRLELSWPPPHDTDGFVRGMRLTADGVDVPLVVGQADTLVVCAKEGLRGGTDYVWELGPWNDKSSNEVIFSHDALPTVRFRTDVGEGRPAETAAECVALMGILDDATLNACDGYEDTAVPEDTGDSADTGETG